jgi:regulator of replication initiation timing
MNTETQVVTTNEKSKNLKNLIIGILAAGVLILAGFLIFNYSSSSKTIQSDQQEIAKATSEKSDIQTSFDASLARLDSMSTVNTNMNTELAGKDAEIAKMKTEIRSILNKKNASASELAHARNLIAKLNGQITDLQQQVALLTTENDSLKVERTALIHNNQTLTRNLDSTNVIKTSLEKKVDVASTLNASNITITPVKVKSNGREKVKTSAKSVDKLIVSFDVNNRIVDPGTKDVYVVVMGPDGQPVINTPNAGTFTTREDGDKSYTAKLPVDLETSKTKKVEFSFAPGSHFKQGNYTIKIYQNGFLIGQGTRELKKGGIFG